MKQLIIYASSMTAFAIVASCSILSTNLAPKASAVITAYCKEPQAERLLVRQEVAAQISPNTLEIHCQGDQ